MRFGWLLLATLLTACGSSPDNTTNSDLQGALADLSGAPSSSDLAGMMGGYPAGPYGNTVGQIIPPLVWEGYVDPAADVIATTEPYGNYSMDDLRQSGKPYAIVHVSDFY